MQNRFYLPSPQSGGRRNYKCLSGATPVLELRANPQEPPALQQENHRGGDPLPAGDHPLLRNWRGGLPFLLLSTPGSLLPAQEKGCKVNPLFTGDTRYSPAHVYIHPFHRLNLREQSIQSVTTGNTLQKKKCRMQHLCHQTK